MKTIVNLIDDPRPGGIRSLLVDMSNAGVWRRENWEVRTVDPVRPIRVNKDCDIIVVHYSMAWRKLPALLLLRLGHRNARLIVVEHHYTQRFETQHVPSTRRFRLMLRLCYRLADLVVAVSLAQARWLCNAGIADPGKLEAIPVSRNYARFLAVPRREKPAGRLVVGALGRLEHAKGFDRLIEAFAGLPAGRFRLRIAGDGSQRERLVRLAAGLEHVEFVGHLDDPAPFFAACDVLAMPSRHEAFGLVCAEAKAAGLPVVVSNVDALPDQAHGCGLVVEAEDVPALRQAIRYISHPQRRQQLGRRARASVANAWSDYLESWSRVLA